jgi:predicted metal-binding protein
MLHYEPSLWKEYYPHVKYNPVCIESHKCTFKGQIVCIKYRSRPVHDMLKIHFIIMTLGYSQFVLLAFLFCLHLYLILDPPLLMLHYEPGLWKEYYPHVKYNPVCIESHKCTFKGRIVCIKYRSRPVHDMLKNIQTL